MTRKLAGKAAKQELSEAALFPPVFIEALAYHESGHAVMAVLLDVPMARVVIGPACDDPAFNGKVELDLSATEGQMQIYKSGLVQVASEPAEKLAPNHARFATLHKTYRHLKPFSRGVRSDLNQAFNAVAVVYQLLGLAENTALKQFKREYRDFAHRLFEITVLRAAVRRLAHVLMGKYELTGEEARETILGEGPLSDNGLLAKSHFPQPSPTTELIRNGALGRGTPGVGLVHDLRLVTMRRLALCTSGRLASRSGDRGVSNLSQFRGDSERGRRVRLVRPAGLLVTMDGPMRRPRAPARPRTSPRQQPCGVNTDDPMPFAFADPLHLPAASRRGAVPCRERCPWAPDISAGQVPDTPVTGGPTNGCGPPPVAIPSAS